MSKQLICSHADVYTASEEICRMRTEYEKQGYKCESILNQLRIYLDDGYVNIWWENGNFYQECISI